MIFFNVVLAYGMETSFLGFLIRNPKAVEDVDGFNLLDHYFILVLALLFRDNLAEWSLIDSQYITYDLDSCIGCLGYHTIFKKESIRNRWCTPQ
jgi:hypothetical protein